MLDDLDGIPRRTHQPDPMRALWNKLEGLQDQLNVLQRAAPSRSMSISGDDGGKITFAPEGIRGYTSTDEETFWFSSADGAALFKGPVTIDGTLSLPAGIINNDALSNPLEPGSAGLSQSNFTITTSPTAKAQATIPVPMGYSEALVMNGVSAGAINSTANTDFLYVSASINGTGGGETISTVHAGTYGSASAFAIRTLTGLNGGDITVETRVKTQNATWAANTTNLASTNAIVLFLR